MLQEEENTHTHTHTHTQKRSIGVGGIERGVTIGHSEHSAFLITNQSPESRSQESSFLPPSFKAIFHCIHLNPRLQTMKFKFVTVTFNDFKSGVITHRDILDDKGDILPVNSLAPGQVVQAYWQAERDVFSAIVRRITGLFFFHFRFHCNHLKTITFILQTKKKKLPRARARRGNKTRRRSSRRAHRKIRRRRRERQRREKSKRRTANQRAAMTRRRRRRRSR